MTELPILLSDTLPARKQGAEPREPEPFHHLFLSRTRPAVRLELLFATLDHIRPVSPQW
jgi:hypothetical protein